MTDKQLAAACKVALSEACGSTDVYQALTSLTTFVQVLKAMAEKGEEK